MNIVISRVLANRCTVSEIKIGGAEFYTVEANVFESVNIMLAGKDLGCLEGCGCS